MTPGDETPPDAETSPEAETAPETPAVRARRRRGLLGWALIVLAVLAVAAGLLLGAGRLAVLTPAGRDLVLGFIAGKEIGRYGRINVEGLSGDLWDDFTLERVTITDREGVWLEAREVRVDWSYLPLITRRFRADAIEADVIRLIRQPVLEDTVEPPGGPMPITVDIGRFQSRVEFLEGFSEEYGRWTVSGDAYLDRSGRRQGAINAISLSRPGDFLRGRFRSADDGGLFGATLTAQALEQRGGPIAGSLGYSPDLPFVLAADIRNQSFDVLVRTGDFTPVQASGRFSENGGQGSGYFSFLGSDLFAPLAERFGPTVRFGIGVAPVAGQPDQYGLGWIVRADNIRGEMRGAATRDGRSVGSGIRLLVETPSVSRLAGTPVAGAGRLEGVWRGEANRWTFEGDAGVADALVAGYGLSRLTGPITVRAQDGRFDVEGDLTGEGGRGSSLLASLIGARPRALIRASRLADSRLLIQRFDLDGAALDISAEGSRGLTGELSARGVARVTDVSRLRRQASGALTLDWRADQRNAGPWALSFTANGQRLRTGFAELDRLLGASPRLVGAGAVGDGRISIRRADLHGAAGRLGAAGVIGMGDGDLRLALDWNARGPFGVGPVEIGGAATGNGALTGTLAEPVLDLTADFAAVEIGPMALTDANLILSFRQGADASNGRVVLTADSPYGPARAYSLFRIADDGVALSDMDINAGGVVAQGDIALRGSAPSSANLTFEARPGAFLAAGQASGRVRLTEGSGDALAFVDVTGEGVRFSGSSYIIRTLRLQGQGTLSRLPFTLVADVGGDLPASFNGSGVYARDGAAQTLTLDGGGRVREVAYQTRSPAIVAMANGGRVVRVDLSVGGGTLTGELRSDSEAASIQASLAGVDLQSIAPDLTGRITAEVNLRGAGDDLSGVINAQLQDARSRDAGADMDIDADIEARLQNDRLIVLAQASDAGGVQSEARLDLPVTASAAPLSLVVNRTEPMTGEITLRGQIRSIWDLVFGGERSLSGMVDGRANVAGTINAPRADGYLNISDGRFEDAATGVVLNDLTVQTRFDSSTARILTFEANDGEGEDAGRVSGQGQLGLTQGSRSNFTLQLTNFRLIDTDLANARASGPLRVTRSASGAISIAGELDVSEAEISAEDLPNTGNVVELDVIEINRPGGLEDEVEESAEERAARQANSAFNLDIRLRSPGGGVFITGRGLDVELGLNARVTGALSAPVLSGNATVIRGDYQFGGRRFQFERGGTVTLSTRAEDIRLNLRAVREDPALTAEIRVTGTAARPIITLGSTPELPQDEILSQVLFGRSASQLSPIEAAQLASSIASLAGGGGFDVVGNLREFAGLDRLSFGGDASGLTIAGGKYIGEDLYFEIIGGGEQGAAVQVEWRARRNISVVSRIGGDGDARLYVRWRRQSRDGSRPERLDRED